jgi:hypothetical protein
MYISCTFSLHLCSLDDLIVSAPMYADYGRNAHDVGRVYVFLQSNAAGSKVRFERDMMVTIDSPRAQNGARFGHSIANGGDINDDGYTGIYSKFTICIVFVITRYSTCISYTKYVCADEEQMGSDVCTQAK